MGLGRFAGPDTGRPQGCPGQGQHTALAIRPGDQRTSNPELGIAKLAQQGPGSPEAEVDPETASFRQRSERLRISGVRRHSRVRSSS